MTAEKRIPTILGLILLLLATAAGISLSSSRQIFTSKASSDCLPSNIQVTNISHKTASISFLTSASCLVSIKINDQIVNDARPNFNTKTKVHYFQVNNLKENTNYHYEVLADGKTYKAASYQFKTGQQPANQDPESNLAWGRVLTPQKTAAVGAVVFLNIPGASPLSAAVTSSGNWNISFASSFNQSLNNWFSPHQDTDEEIIVLSENSDPTIISANTNINNPVPDIILGQNYFSDEAIKASNHEGFLNNLTPSPISKKLSITYPKEAETISSLKPEFIGTGPDNKTINIRLSNFTQTWEVTPDSTGNWRWAPPSGVLPGQNSITVSTSQETLTRSFKVDTQSGLAFVASQSSSPAISPSPSPSPTILPTLTPTTRLLPSPTIRAAHPSTDSGVPQPGAGSLTLLMVSLSTIIIFVSLHLLRKSSNF